MNDISLREVANKVTRQQTPTLALVMIVKNEASVIERALNSVRPLIDYALICDTGSDDGTQEIIKAWLQGNDVEGKVIEEPWRNFGYNRSYVLEQLRYSNFIDYAFMLDADEIVEISVEPKLIKQRLGNFDLHNVDMRLGTTAYELPRVTNNRLPFFYRGPAHEWPDCKTKFSKGHLDGITVVELRGGAREKDPNTYRHDAELFEQELKRGDLDALEYTRYTFYLAQSLRDAGELERSLATFQRRVDLGGWHEEVYISVLNAARLQERLKYPLAEILKTYKRAIALNPKRLEAFYGATRVLRLADLFHEGLALSLPAIRMPLYTGLFVETWIYDFGLLDEFSICAYYAGDYTAAWLAMQVLLCKNLDDATRKRVTANVRFAQLAK